MIATCQILALVLFITLFAGLATRVARRRASSYDRDARLPLEDDHV